MDRSTPLHVLGLAGSLRAGSYNKALLRVARELAPATMTIDDIDIGRMPLFDEDVEAQGDPDEVDSFKQAIAAADGLLIATPEYQRGVPGVLKNALDWSSRPAGESVMRGKVAAIMGATPGQGGTARAQMQLRQTLAFTGTHVVLDPEVLVSDAGHRFREGRLVDEAARKFVSELLDGLADLIVRLAR